MANTSVLCLLVVIVGLASGDDVDSMVLKLEQGLVKGYKATEGEFYAFYGIPYATAPTGPDKFKAPLPAPTWTETFEAVNKEIFCPQIKSIVYAGYQEDCLITNVFVPITVEKPLPVLVIVHGGAYLLGNGNTFTPYAIVNQGKFIVVNFNYRLGVHGFLCLGTEVAPGNAGMKDQVAALRWVKNNIAKFGGDPNDVTISGGSAGASAVELLMLSETTKGLFHKVMSDSGNAVSVWSVQIDPLENAKGFAQLYNVITDDTHILEDFFKKATYEQLTAHSTLGQKDSVFVHVPCIERDIGIERFIKEAPVDILKSGNFPKMPVQIGLANMEGLMNAQYFEEWKNEMNKNFSTFLPADLQFKYAVEREKVVQRIREFYFGTDEINDDTLLSIVDYFSDVMFAYPALRTVKLLVEAGHTDVYLYQYSYSDEVILSKRLYPHLGGADHCTQCSAFLEFTAMAHDENLITDDYKKMRGLIRRLWTNFILSGKPLEGPTSEFPKGWAASSANRSPYMELNMPPELRDALLPERAQFWDEIYENYYRTPVPPPEPKVGRSEL